MLKCIKKLTKSYIKSNICIQDKIILLLAVTHFLIKLQLQLLFYQVLSIKSSSSSALWSQNLMLKSYYCFQKRNLWISIRFKLLLKNWVSKFLMSKKSAKNLIYASTANFNILILMLKTALIRTKKNHSSYHKNIWWHCEHWWQHCFFFKKCLIFVQNYVQKFSFFLIINI